MPLIAGSLLNDSYEILYVLDVVCIVGVVYSRLVGHPQTGYPKKILE